MINFNNIQPGQRVSGNLQFPPLASGENCCAINWQAQCGAETIVGTREECITAESTTPANFIRLADMDTNVAPGDETFLVTNSDNGYLPVPGKPAGLSEPIRSEIQPFANFGSQRFFLFPPGVEEVYISWCMLLGSNFTPTQSVKLPGLSSAVLTPWTTNPAGAGGAGGNWGGGCRSWSARHYVNPFIGNRVGIELYHKNSNNFGSTSATLADHPCDNPANDPVQANLRQFGENVAGSAGPGNISSNNWHCFKQRVRLNTIGQFDGLVRTWIDGTLVIDETGLNLTDNPAFRQMAFFFQVFHGGSDDTSGTTHDIFFDCINYSIGSTDNTVCYC